MVHTDRPPSMSETAFEDDCNKLLDKCFKVYENIILLGDLNYYILDVDRSQPLRHVCDIFKWCAQFDWHSTQN